jgi:ribonuclease HI
MKVKAHVGILGNEMVDEQADKGCKKDTMDELEFSVLEE